MMMDFARFKRLKDVAAGFVPADLVVRNARIVNVFTQEVVSGDVAVAEGMIAGLAGGRQGKEEIDAGGRFLVPAFIDAHVHIESSLVTPDVLSDVVVPRGVTCAVADPHEIANVAGEIGIRYMVAASRGLPLECRIMLPSCVPATPLETAGAELPAASLRPLYGKEGIGGLAEMMNSPGVLYDDEVLRKVWDARQADAVVDGHGAILDAKGLDVYAALGIGSDHESLDAEGVRERLRRGIWTFIRHGTAARNLELVKGIDARNYRRACFCTDDRHLDDLVAEGGIDAAVRGAIALGLDPLLAISMASLNAAEAFRLHDRGAVAPGFRADFFLCDDLQTVQANEVFAGGRLVARGGRVLEPTAGKGPALPSALLNSVRFKEFSSADLAIPLQGAGRMNLIGVVPGQIITRLEIEAVSANNGAFQPDAARDQAKLLVIERHRHTGNIGKCGLKGLGLRRGAIASTVAHDSHNLVIAGMYDADIRLAAAELERIGGGYAVAANGRILASLSLEVAGLLTRRPAADVLADLAKLHAASLEVAEDRGFNIFLTLSFLALPVIPEVKLTDRGLVDVRKFDFIDPVAR